MVGIEDIARELNVSISLVSKVLNDRLGTTRVSAKTLKAIRERAAAMGYRKNESAAALARGRHNLLGVFIHYIGMPGSMLIESLLEGISEVADAHDERVLLQYYQTADRFRTARRQLHSNAMDGAILGGLPHVELKESLEEIQAGGIPVVTVHDEELHKNFGNVTCSQREIGRMAVAHLVERGCTRIATLNKHLYRWQGYRDGLKEAGLPIREELEIRVPTFGVEAGVTAVRQLLDNGARFDGVVAQSDQQGIGVIHELIRRELRVPEDVKVIGVDNSPLCETAWVPLSSISQEYKERGRLAVNLMMERLSGQGPRTVEVPPVLHARASTG